jgi:plastocyanin
LKNRLLRPGLAVLAGIVIMASCGGGSGGPKPPTGPGGSTTTITIRSTGADPRTVTVPLGTRIRWVNSDNRPHEMSSDPHPEHDRCPEINGGVLTPGQSRETSNLVVARTCGFHDHLNPDQANLNGTIIVQ